MPRDTKFQPRTRNEIKACEWFAVADLPNSKKDNTPKVKMGVNANSFFMVLPFMKRIKAFVQPSAKPKRHRQKSSSISEGEISSCNTNNKSTNNAKSQQREADDALPKRNREKRNALKRQLFIGSNTQEISEFSAPSWLNFKFDKSAIMECIL